MVYFNKKAQSLTELSAFGAVLLLVLSFLISYGMRYNYQQEIQMRAFRTALAQAYLNTNRPDASASVVLVEDRHVPDPRDMFGVGNITPIQGSAEVTWGNSMQEEYPGIADDSLLPRMKYIFNDRNAAIQKVEREYKTAGYSFIAKDSVLATGTEFYAILPGNPEPQLILWPNVKCYQPTADSPRQAMVLLPDNEREVITEVYVKPVRAGLAKRFIKYQVIGVRTDPPDGKDGDPIDRINLLSPDSGQINPNYTQLNNDIDMDGVPDVTAANIQGLLFEDEQKIRRSGTVTIKETPGTSESLSTYSFKDKSANPTTITHKIRSNSGVENISSPFERNRGFEWATPK